MAELSGRALRYYLQSVVRELVGPHDRVRKCLRTPIMANVGVGYSRKFRRASYVGLCVCGRVWDCPVCAAKIAERRRGELRLAIEAGTEEGLRPALVTLTVRHHRGDDLGRLLDGLRGAQAALRRTSGYRSLIASVGFAGAVTGLEVTHGTNGWHPHVHRLDFLGQDADLAVYENQLHDMWAAQVARVGLDAVNDHGASVAAGESSGGVLELYLTKMGHWDLAREVTGAATKRSKGKAGRTPGQLLYDYADGDAQAGSLWRVFQRVFKGRHHLHWSRGLRARLLRGTPALSDEEAAAAVEDDWQPLALLERKDWRRVLRSGLRERLLRALEAVAGQGVEGVRNALASLGMGGEVLCHG